MIPSTLSWDLINMRSIILSYKLIYENSYESVACLHASNTSFGGLVNLRSRHMPYKAITKSVTNLRHDSMPLTLILEFDYFEV